MHTLFKLHTISALYDIFSVVESFFTHSLTGPYSPVVERPPVDRKVGGSIPGRVKPIYYKMVVMAPFPDSRVLKVSITTGSSVSG